MRHKIMTPLLVLTVLASTASAHTTTTQQSGTLAHQRQGVNGQDDQNRARSGDDRTTPGRAAQATPNRPDARQGRTTDQNQRGNAARTPRDTHVHPVAPSGERGTTNTTPAQQGAALNALGGALRGATSVTFYNGDPLRGAQATQSIQLSGLTATQAAALTRAAQQASFAVIERPGGRIVVDLKAATTQPGQPTPRVPQRR